jgi:hypothetical protein
MGFIENLPHPPYKTLITTRAVLFCCRMLIPQYVANMLQFVNVFRESVNYDCILCSDTLIWLSASIQQRNLPHQICFWWINLMQSGKR